MKSRNILILALVMALITTFLFNSYLKNLDKKYKKNQNKINVVVAKKDIKKNQKVTKDMLELKEISEDSVQPETVKKIEEIEGKYSLADIKENEQLLTYRFTNQFEENQLVTRKIREGFRAVSIEVNLVESVSNLIQTEDNVDVVFSENLKQDGTKNNITTEVILDNVRVLAVGKRLNEDNAESNVSNDPKQKENDVQYTTVTLELKPEDAVRLINSDEKGSIKLMLRSKMFP